MKKYKIKNRRNYNNEKGITLITLVVAVSIMIIISGMLIYNAKNGIKMRNLKMMQNDIDLLNNKVDAYYVKYGALPAEIEYNVIPLPFESYKSPNDNDKYYVLDLKAFEGLTLNYGADFKNVTAENVADYTDIYVINEQSHHIYYVRGIEMDGVWYHTNDEDEEIALYHMVEIAVKDLSYVKLDTGNYQITLKNVQYNQSYNVKCKEKNDSEYIDKGADITTDNFTFEVNKYGIYYIILEDKLGKTKQLISSIYAGTTIAEDNIKVEMVKTITDSGITTEEVAIPNGFTISGVASECAQTTLGVSESNEKKYTIDDGVVIYLIDDGSSISWNDTTAVETAQTTYDQFVWVPVPNAIAKDKNSDGTIDTTDIDLMIADEEYPMAIAIDATNYRGILYDFTLTDGKVTVSDKAWSVTSTSNREPAYLTNSSAADASSYNTVGITESSLQTEFNTMVNKVSSKKGFWVGRYETSNMAGTASTIFDDALNKRKVVADTTNKITVIKGTTTGISYDASIPNYINWYRMYAQQKNYSNLASITATSSMIWGSQWEQIMIWMKNVDNTSQNSKYVVNSIGMGNFGTISGVDDGWSSTSTPAPTGYQEEYKVKNVYDLAGNVDEWSLEATNTFNRVLRGSSYNYTGSSSTRAVSRGFSYPYYSSTRYGSRSTLY